MNAVPPDEELSQGAPQGPGAELRRQREARELDVAQAAAMLHLSQGMLVALEADDYEQLPGAVFVQGYLRKYAKLLEIPAEPLLEAFGRVRPSEKRAKFKVAHTNQEVRSSDAPVRLVSRLIVLAVLVLGLTWWYGYLTPGGLGDGGESPAQARVGEEGPGTPALAAVEELSPESMGDPVGPLLPVSPEAVTPPLEEAPEGRSAQLMSAPAAPASQPTAIDSAAQQEPTGEALAPSPGAQAPAPVSPGPVPVTPAASDSPSAPLPVAAPEPATEPATEPAPAEPQAPPVEISLLFSGESWVSIRDASGGFQIQGLVAKESRRVLGGEAPYNVVLGNASQVEIRIGGQPWDFSRYIKGNVARFTLNPGAGLIRTKDGSAGIGAARSRRPPVSTRD
ncbi:MAG: RodZ domain-containing protein [Candidatus Sedimenticola endophacoides]